jgi:hypothetical protein
MTRYEAGETLANIARTYDCSAPAISYIVSRSRARGALPTPRAPTLEPQLIKSHPTELYSHKVRRRDIPTSVTPPNSSAPHLPQHETEETTPDPSIRDDGEKRAQGGSSRSPDLAVVPPKDSEPGHTLHLAPSYADDSQPGTGPQSGRGDASTVAGRSAPATPVAQGFEHSIRPEANIMPMRLISESRISGDRGTFIDRALRDRVEADIAMFLAAFDSALAQDTPESRAELREATDRLLRAGARTRIELERLEARLPLPPRNSGKQYEPAGWQR